MSGSSLKKWNSSGFWKPWEPENANDTEENVLKVVKKCVNEFGFGGEDDQAVPEADSAKEEEEKKTIIDLVFSQQFEKILQ
ncbi:hypothetical protein VNO80_29984 [Phaseolus coccineus]|uniref:Uncharacterized protein n=1 Tax=Phaseolus coccineus TaxID=3886 RepID=A0AAN9LFD0_PHACN